MTEQHPPTVASDDARNIESPRPEPLPFRWPSQDLKNLVQLAPMSVYTRALLRIKFNRPVPENCTTFEQVEQWLATLPPLKDLPSPRQSFTQAVSVPRSTYHRLRDEVHRGEYISVTGRIEGHTNCIENWTQELTVEVPLSIWEDGVDAVRDYVEDKVRDADRDYGDTESTGDGDDDGLEIEEDLDDLMAEAEEAIARRDSTDTDDEDEDDE